MPILSSVLSFVASYGNVVWWLCLLHLSPPCEGLLTKIIVSVNRQYSSKGCQWHTERYFSGCSLGWGLSRVRYSSLHYCSDVDSPWFPVHIFSRYNTLMYLTKLFTRLVSLCTCTRQECWVLCARVCVCYDNSQCVPPIIVCPVLLLWIKTPSYIPGKVSGLSLIIIDSMSAL